MKFTIENFFGICDQIRRKLFTVIDEILNVKLHFLSSDICKKCDEYAKHIILFKLINNTINLKKYYSKSVKAVCKGKVLQLTE